MENYKEYIKDLLISIIFSLCLGIVGVFLLSIISYIFEVSQNCSDICIYIILVLMFFCSGFIIGRKRKCKAAIWGLIVGVVLILLFLITGRLFFSLNTISFKKSPFLLLISIVGSVLGININLNLGKKKRRVKFKRNKNK